MLDVAAEVIDTTEAAAGSGATCGGHGGTGRLLDAHTGRTTRLTIRTQRSDVARSALALLLVRDQFGVRISLFAWALAFELEHVQNLRHDPVVWLHHVNLVADETLELATRNLFLLGRETSEACTTAKLLAMLASEHVSRNHHARGTLKVARELIETEGLVEV